MTCGACAGFRLFGRVGRSRRGERFLLKRPCFFGGSSTTGGSSTGSVLREKNGIMTVGVYTLKKLLRCSNFCKV